jgi:hypothetical protein
MDQATGQAKRQNSRIFYLKIMTFFSAVYGLAQLFCKQQGDPAYLLRLVP